MRILLVHTATSDWERRWYQNVASEAPDPISVTCFCLVFPGLRRKLHWEELDVAWRARHPSMMQTYGQLVEAAAQADVLLLYNGWNLHPEFLQCLPTFNVYSCFDDPDSSRFLSEPVAAAFDAAFYGNVASRFQYEAWGCHRLAHFPIFTSPGDVPVREDRKRVLTHARDNDIVLCCGQSQWRSHRLKKLAGAFSQARCFGKGWQTGFVPIEELLDVYRRSRIGWNVHNSTGPINQRLFALAAWNILQICDNRTGLAEVFDVGQEVIGFDTIDEAIEATHYYLDHEEERRAIAARAFDRYWREYHAAALWQRVAGQVQAWRSETSGTGQPPRAMSDLPSPGFLSRFGLMSEKVRPLAQRLRKSWVKRMARGHWPVDEAYYLSESVPYEVGSKHRYLKYRRASHVSLDADRALRSQVLCWAATALIRSAKAIQVLDSRIAGVMCGYACAAPDRQVQKVDASTRKTGDLVLGFPEDTETLEATLSRTDLAPRCILGFDAEALASLGGADALYATLKSRFASVSVFWLPDPIVPWVEPLPGPLARVSILIEAHSPQ